MKRFLALALLFGVLAPIGMSGCGEEPKTTTPTTSAPTEAPKAPAETPK
jgi:hypothetical protein